MVFISNLFKCLLVLTLLFCCQICLATSTGNDHELNEIDLGDDLYDTLPIQHHQLRHQDYRRASLRYQPHVLYKKASLRPIIGQNGKLTFTKREEVRRFLTSLANDD